MSKYGRYILVKFCRYDASATSSYPLISGAHPEGLFGCHDRPLCTAGRLVRIKADDKISNIVTAGL